jgi:hypothetical protein
MNSEEIKKLQQVVRIGRADLVIPKIAEEIRSRLTPKQLEPLKDMEKNIERGLNDDPTMDLEKFIENIVNLARKNAFRP